MRTQWQLAGLAFLALGVTLFLLVPLFTVQVTVDMPPASTNAAPETVNHIATWIVIGVGLTFALTALGTIAWVVRHLLRRGERPDD